WISHVCSSDLRGIEQATETACDDEPCEELGVGRLRSHAAKQSGDRLLGASKRFDLEVRVEVVSDAEIGVDLERPPKRLVGFAEMLVAPFNAVLRKDALDWSQLRPGRRAARIF